MPVSNRPTCPSRTHPCSRPWPHGRRGGRRRPCREAFRDPSRRISLSSPTPPLTKLPAGGSVLAHPTYARSTLPAPTPREQRNHRKNPSAHQDRRPGGHSPTEQGTVSQARLLGFTQEPSSDLGRRRAIRAPVRKFGCDFLLELAMLSPAGRKPDGLIALRASPRRGLGAEWAEGVTDEAVRDRFSDAKVRFGKRRNHPEPTPAVHRARAHRRRIRRGGVAAVFNGPLPRQTVDAVQASVDAVPRDQRWPRQRERNRPAGCHRGARLSFRAGDLGSPVTPPQLPEGGNRRPGECHFRGLDHERGLGGVDKTYARMSSALSSAPLSQTRLSARLSAVARLAGSSDPKRCSRHRRSRALQSRRHTGGRMPRSVSVRGPLIGRS